MTVKQVAVRELKSHLSRYLAEAAAGATNEVASHRRVVARVTGVVAPTDAFAKMAVKGLLQPGSGEAPAGGSR